MSSAADAEAGSGRTVPEITLEPQNGGPYIVTQAPHVLGGYTVSSEPSNGKGEHEARLDTATVHENKNETKNGIEHRNDHIEGEGDKGTEDEEEEEKEEEEEEEEEEREGEEKEEDEGDDDDGRDEDEDEDEEPSLKYERLGGSFQDLFQKDSTSALAISNKLLVM